MQQYPHPNKIGALKTAQSRIAEVIDILQSLEREDTDLTLGSTATDLVVLQSGLSSVLTAWVDADNEELARTLEPAPRLSPFAQQPPETQALLQRYAQEQFNAAARRIAAEADAGGK